MNSQNNRWSKTVDAQPDGEWMVPDVKKVRIIVDVGGIEMISKCFAYSCMRATCLARKPTFSKFSRVPRFRR